MTTIFMEGGDADVQQEIQAGRRDGRIGGGAGDGAGRSSQLLHDWLFKDEPFDDYLSLGALYVESDFPGCPGFDRLLGGIYTLKLRQDLKVVALDSEGNEFVIGYAEKRQQQPFFYHNTKFAAPISGWLTVILILCAGGDVTICYTQIECEYEQGEPKRCRMIRVCVGC